MQARKQIELDSAKHSVPGRAALHSGFDVIQTALVRELGRQGIAHGSKSLWKVCSARLSKRSSAPATAEDRVAALLHIDDNNDLKMMLIDERRFVLSGIDDVEEHEGQHGSHVRIVFRLDQFLDEMIGRLEAIIETRADYTPNPNWKPGRPTLAMSQDAPVETDVELRAALSATKKSSRRRTKA